MIRILHTSDWHLGHTLYNYDRSEEQMSMLMQIEKAICARQPDVLLICGDIFHTAQASASVQTMFTEAVVRMHRACPKMTTIITAGNHDSGSRHEIFKAPWRALNVHVIGNIEKENPDGHIIEIPGKGTIVAVPYSHGRNIPEGYFQKLLDIAMERNRHGLPVIMAAHTTVRGCNASGHDNANEYTVGGIDYLELGEMGHGYDYLALGHIHNGQFVQGSQKRARYCGTPLAVNFDETFHHSISLVEIESHGSMPQVEEIAIENPRPLVTLPAEGTADLDEAMELLKNFPDEIPAYIRLNIAIEDYLPAEAFQEAVALTAGKQCRFCHINAKRKSRKETEAKALTVQEFQEEAPVDIAHRFAEDTGRTFDREMEDMFREIVELLEDERRNG